MPSKSKPAAKSANNLGYVRPPVAPAKAPAMKGGGSTARRKK